MGLTSDPMNPIRSIIAVLGAFGLVALVTEALEFTLVSAVAGGSITDMGSYLAVRNRPGMLAAKIAYTGAAGILGGYMAAKVAGTRELLHGGLAAALQTATLLWGFTAGEFAASTPLWARAALIVVTGPAMLAGASIRARAAEAGETRRV